MLYAVEHSLGVSLVHARSPKSAEKFIREEYGRRSNPKATTDKIIISMANSTGAFQYDPFNLQKDSI